MQSDYHYTVQLADQSVELTIRGKSQSDALAGLVDAILFAKITDAYSGAKNREKGDGTSNGARGYIDFPELKGRQVFAPRPAKKAVEEPRLIKDNMLSLHAPQDKPPKVKNTHRSAALAAVERLQEEHDAAA